jgi:hypothetical protein
MLTKTLRFDDDVVSVLAQARWSDDGLSVVLVGQLERSLYEKVNKALTALGGKWNRKAGAHIFPLDPREQVDGLLNDGTLQVARDGFFETPRDLAERMIALAKIKPTMRVLEPSAGLGAIAKLLTSYPLDVCEKNEQRAAHLMDCGFNVVARDFLTYSILSYDRIVQNPPFEEHQDVDHVLHAYHLLANGGRLVSVCSESPFFRDDKKSVDFRDWLDRVGYSEKLPEGTFKSSGTSVNTRLVIADK